MLNRSAGVAVEKRLREVGKPHCRRCWEGRGDVNAGEGVEGVLAHLVRLWVELWYSWSCRRWLEIEIGEETEGIIVEWERRWLDLNVEDGEYQVVVVQLQIWVERALWRVRLLHRVHTFASVSGREGWLFKVWDPWSAQGRLWFCKDGSEG